jgi:hypothetical protein
MMIMIKDFFIKRFTKNALVFIRNLNIILRQSIIYGRGMINAKTG